MGVQWNTLSRTLLAPTILSIVVRCPQLRDYACFCLWYSHQWNEQSLERSISRHWDHVTNHFAMWSNKMAGREWASLSMSETSSSDGVPASKRKMLLVKNINKWIAEYDKELNTSGTPSSIVFMWMLWRPPFVLISKVSFKARVTIILPTSKTVETYEWVVLCPAKNINVWTKVNLIWQHDRASFNTYFEHCHPYLVSPLFAVPLSLHVVTFLIFLLYRLVTTMRPYVPAPSTCTVSAPFCAHMLKWFSHLLAGFSVGLN